MQLFGTRCMSLILSIANLSVELTQFLNADCPRIRADIGAVTYTGAGTAVGNGTFYEPKHLWEVTTFCDPSQMQLIKLIFAKHDRLRRTKQPCDLLILDFTELYEDTFPPTRGFASALRNDIIPDTSPIVIPANNPTDCLYYAQFKAWFSQAPKLTKKGGDWAVQFTLVETGRVEP